jgi:large subunit ribosomal protein L6
MKEKTELKIEIPEGAEIKIDDSLVTVKGQKGEISRRLVSRKVKLKLEGKEVVIFSKALSTKREKAVAGTFRAHIKNMIKGVTEGHVYKLKICSGHFPMNIEVKNDEFIVKNFLGESIPRVLKLKKGIDVKIEGKDIILESTDKELAGQTASSIEELTKRPGFDKRIFQDGIYIYYKDGKEIQ